MKALVERHVAERGVGFSLEVFPPKSDAARAAFDAQTLPALAALRPAFVDVTCGAGGSGDEGAATLAICERLQTRLGVPAVAHVPCRGVSPAAMRAFVDKAVTRGVRFLLALRGDVAAVGCDDDDDANKFEHASDLVAWLRATYPAELLQGVAVAAYPEKHPEAPSLAQDIARLQAKVAAGADAAITQLFLDPHAFLAFRKQLADAGGLPCGARLVPGVLLVGSVAGLQRMLRLCGTVSVPADVSAELEQLRSAAQADVQAFGVRLAASICRALYAAGERFFHIYTLNAAGPCRQLVDALALMATEQQVPAAVPAADKGDPEEEHEQA